IDAEMTRFIELLPGARPSPPFRASYYPRSPAAGPCGACAGAVEPARAGVIRWSPGCIRVASWVDGRREAAERVARLSRQRLAAAARSHAPAAAAALSLGSDLHHVRHARLRARHPESRPSAGAAAGDERDRLGALC